MLHPHLFLLIYGDITDKEMLARIINDPKISQSHLNIRLFILFKSNFISLFISHEQFINNSVKS